jgi:hypothetical protein
MQSASRGIGPASRCKAALRATSHARLTVHDHGNVRALIGRKGGDRPSSLHTRRRRPKRPKEKLMDEKSTWSPTWQVVNKGARSTIIYANFGRP